MTYVSQCGDNGSQFVEGLFQMLKEGHPIYDPQFFDGLLQVFKEEHPSCGPNHQVLDLHAMKMRIICCQRCRSKSNISLRLSSARHFNSNSSPPLDDVLHH